MTTTGWCGDSAAAGVSHTDTLSSHIMSQKCQNIPLCVCDSRTPMLVLLRLCVCVCVCVCVCDMITGNPVLSCCALYVWEQCMHMSVFFRGVPPTGPQNGKRPQGLVLAASPSAHKDLLHLSTYITSSLQAFRPDELRGM